MKSFIILICLAIFSISIGCSSVKKPRMVIDKIINTPRVYIETLKHPTEFPTEYIPEVLNIEETLKLNPLGEGEDVKLLLISESKLSNTYFVQIRKDSEIKTHYHKAHDKTVYVKKGRGIAILNGTRYLVQPGTVLQIPNNTQFKLINTGDELFVAVSVFTPPFDGKDIIYPKEEEGIKEASEAEKEKRRLEKEKGKLVTDEDDTSKDKKIDDEEVKYTANELVEPEKEKEEGGSNKEDVSYSNDKETSRPEYLYEVDKDYAYDQTINKKADKGEGLNNHIEKNSTGMEAIDQINREDDLEVDFDKHITSINSGQVFEKPDKAETAPFVYDNNNQSDGFIPFDEGESNTPEDDILIDTDKILKKEYPNIKDRLQRLDELKAANLITEEEYQNKRAELLEIEK